MQGISQLTDAVASYLDLADPDAVSVVLAGGISNFVDGSPLWPMIIGASSGGKSELVLLLEDVQGAVQLDEVTGPGLLSSKEVGKNKPQQVTVGALQRIGERGLVIVSDFSTVLATSDRGGRDQLFALLRKVYDGRVQRDLGNLHKPLVWTGRATVIAACTPAIDHFSAYADQLGPRFLYCRLVERNGSGKRGMMRAARNGGATKAGARKEAKRLGAALVDEARARVPDDVDDDVNDAVEDAALVVCKGRASVPRNGYTREVIGRPSEEEPSRVYQQLHLLARCLVALDLRNEDVVRIVRRCALDSMPEVRKLVLQQAAIAYPKPVTAYGIAKTARGDHKMYGRVVRDFVAIGALTSDENAWLTEGGAIEGHRVVLAPDTADLILAVFDKHPGQEYGAA